MPLYTDWVTVSENGAHFDISDINPLSGLSSLRLYSDGSEWDMTASGFRKSASVFLTDSHPRGFSDGKIRTLIRRNSSDNLTAWAGIYFLSNQLGIGTRLETDINCYQVSDENGRIRIWKITDNIKTSLLNTGVELLHNQTYGLEVSWEYQIDLSKTLIIIKLGTNPNFSDLITIGIKSDIESLSNVPHQFSLSEGLFGQTESSEHIIDYSFDSTTISRFISI